MIVTIDCNTKPVELYHLSILFQSLAKAHGFVAPVASNKVSELTVELNIDTTDATAAIDKLAAHAASNNVSVEVLPPVTYSVETIPVNTDHASIDDVGTVSVHVTPPTTDTNLDVNGLPWDARIHAGSRERNTDGSWRVRRKPKTVEQDEWDATLARVTAELTDLMAIPVSPGAVADAAAETREMIESLGDTLVDVESGPFYWVHPESSCCGKVDSREELNEVLGDGLVEEIDVEQYDKFAADGYTAAGLPVTKPVVVAPPVTIAPPVVVPPVTAVAPPITVDKPAIETFAQLMSWLTSRTPKDEAAKPAMVTRVNEILAANGLTTLQQLGQRADLIPQVLAQFIEAFGE